MPRLGHCPAPNLGHLYVGSGKTQRTLNSRSRYRGSPPDQFVSKNARHINAYVRIWTSSPKLAHDGAFIQARSGPEGPTSTSCAEALAAKAISN
jgi:hypothetical protein